jgi:hypothetical protein
MRTYKPINQMTPEEKAGLKALMLAKGMDDSDVFPGVLGNRISAFVNKPLRRKTVAALKSAEMRGAS